MIQASTTSRTSNSSVVPKGLGKSAEFMTDSAREAAYDVTLIERFNRNDETAFVEIMQRYHGKIFGLAHNLLRNAADAEEIAQDTFIRAHRGLANFRADTSLATWLYRI